MNGTLPSACPPHQGPETWARAPKLSPGTPVRPSGWTPGPRAGQASLGGAEGVGVGVQEAREPGRLDIILLPGVLLVQGSARSRQVAVAG